MGQLRLPLALAALARALALDAAKLPLARLQALPRAAGRVAGLLCKQAPPGLLAATQE